MAFGGTVVILLLVGLGFGGTAAAVTGDTAAVWQSIVGAAVFAPAVWLLVGLTTAAIGLAPRASAFSWAFLAICFVIGMFGQLLELPTWVQDISPFQHVPPYPASDLRAGPLVALVAIAGGLTAVGLAGLRRRDIG